MFPPEGDTPDSAFLMKYSLNVLLCLLFLLLCAVPAFGQAGEEAFFSIGFQQKGRNIPVKNHQVTLKKKTFTIVVTFKQPDSVLVNASDSPESFEAAKNGKPFDLIPGFADLGMAEEAFNPKSLLMLSSDAPHYWFYQDGFSHRFNDITQQDGLWVCRRIVGQVMYRDTSRNLVQVPDMPEDELYLVFIRTEWTENFSQQYETQREYVKILFE